MPMNFYYLQQRKLHEVYNVPSSHKVEFILESKLNYFIRYILFSKTLYFYPC